MNPERTLRRLFRSATLPVWYHPAFRLPLGQSGRVAMDPRRADNVLTWLLDHRITSDRWVFEAPEASFSDLLLVHDDEWLATVDTQEGVNAVCGGAILNGPAMVELWRRGCGATLSAARHVREHGGVAATLMGGFHHAAPDRGSGFCALNDVAMAIAVLRSEGLEGPILVLDLDAHPPDGLAEFDLQRVDVRSVSVESHWEARGVLDLRVRPGADDVTYLIAVRRALTSIGAPMLVFYLAGADPLKGDQLGELGVTMKGLRQRDRLVFTALKEIPTVILPAGGYTSDAWKVYAHTLTEATNHHDAVEPSYDPIARRVGRIARTLAPFESDDLEITEADILGLGPTVERRFLGHYTRHGLEYAFERYGLFEMIRQAGFADPTIGLETSRWPHRLWVDGTFEGTRYRVADLAVRFSHWEGYRLLFIDWLELKDPRRQAGSHRLPGQDHPGLGMSREVIQVLGVSARRLNLAGLQFVPSHYHVAWIARNLARHPDPQARGVFLALREVTDGLPLGAVSRRLHHPGFPTEEGEMLTWQPAPMIHAIDASLFEQLKAEDEATNRVRRNTVFRLAEINPATL